VIASLRRSESPRALRRKRSAYRSSSGVATGSDVPHGRFEESGPGNQAQVPSNDAARDEQEYRLPHSPDAAALARRLVEEHLSPLVDEERRADLIVLTSELVSNAVRHSPPLPDGTHQLLFGIDPDAVRIAVTDGGKHLEPDALTFEGAGDGRFGMVMLDRWADGWGFSLDGVKGVWFKVAR
jgi:anti-sigma regulatory factor (Ser/Thr protein kinase)